MVSIFYKKYIFGVVFVFVLVSLHCPPPTWVVLKIWTPALPFFPRTLLSSPPPFRYMYLEMSGLVYVLYLPEHNFNCEILAEVNHYWYQLCFWKSDYQPCQSSLLLHAVNSDPVHSHAVLVLPAAEDPLDLVGGAVEARALRPDVPVKPGNRGRGHLLACEKLEIGNCQERV